MYWPYLSRRTPSNLECRIATIETAAGWATVLGAAMGTPMFHRLGWFSGEMLLFAFAAFLAWHGIATLQRADPVRGVLLLTFGRRMGNAQLAAPLDERDLLLRYRAFNISYTLLYGVLWGGGLIQIGVGLSEFPRPMSFFVPFVFSLWFGPLLPIFVLPWLERDELADEPLAQARHVASGEGAGGVRLYPRWVRIVASPWLVWTLAALAMIWLFHQVSPHHLSTQCRFDKASAEKGFYEKSCLSGSACIDIVSSARLRSCAER